MKAIGFANQYYTLWEVNTYTETCHGEKYKVTRCTYLKNISTNIEKVKELYPNTDIDDNLRGHSCNSFEEREKIMLPLGYFNWGKYYGTKMEDCQDIDYLSWAWNSFNDKEKSLLSKKMEDNGYVIHDGYLWTKEWSEKVAKKEQFKQSVLNHELKELQFDKNLNYEGCYYNNDICYKFLAYKLLSYSGYEYGLPILNGKAKRLKGKTIQIKSYDVEQDNDEIIVTIKDFEICK